MPGPTPDCSPVAVLAPAGATGCPMRRRLIRFSNTTFRNFAWVPLCYALAALTAAGLWLAVPLRATETLSTLHAKSQQAGLAPATVGRVIALAYEQNDQERAAILSRVLPLLIQAQHADLPLEPLLDRLEEGFAKQVDGERLMAALQRKQADLAFAQELLIRFQAGDTPGSRQYAITIVASSLELGLEREAARRFAIPLLDQSLATMVALALETKALLGQLDFRSELIDPLLYSAVAQQALNEPWRRLAPLVALARQRGLTDEAVATAAAAVLQRRGSPRELLALLGFTPRSLSRRPLESSASP